MPVRKRQKMHTEIYNSMVVYYDDGKFEQDADTVYLPESEFDFETKLGIHAFYDMSIYKTSPNANCITEDFINSNRYRNPEKLEMLQSMLNSGLGLFDIVQTDADKGYACIREVFTGNEYTLTDIGLSGSPNCETTYLYSRIITYRDVSFGSGLNLIFKKSDRFIQGFIKRHKKDYKPFEEYTRFVELYRRFFKDSNGMEVVGNLP